MILQTLRASPTKRFSVLSQTRLYDTPVTGGRYRRQLHDVLGAYFETNAETLTPRRELSGSLNAIPDIVRMLDDDGQVVASYSTTDLAHDTGLPIVSPR